MWHQCAHIDLDTNAQSYMTPDSPKVLSVCQWMNTQNAGAHPVKRYPAEKQTVSISQLTTVSPRTGFLPPSMIQCQWPPSLLMWRAPTLACVPSTHAPLHLIMPTITTSSAVFPPTLRGSPLSNQSRVRSFVWCGFCGILWLLSLWLFHCKTLSVGTLQHVEPWGHAAQRQLRSAGSWSWGSLLGPWDSLKTCDFI